MKTFKKGVLLVSLSLLVLDQFIKILIIRLMEPREEIALIPGLMRIVYTEYAGRGIWALRFSTVLIAFVASCFFTAVLFISNEPETLRGRMMLCAAVPAAAGCVSVFGERLIRGVNINYIAISDFSPFNLSNCYIVIGLLTLVVYALFLDRFLSKKEPPVDNREHYR